MQLFYPDDWKVYRYPADIGVYDNGIPWVLFEVMSSRHVGRNNIRNNEPNTPERSIRSAVLYLPPEALKSSQDIDWKGEEYGPAIGKVLDSTALAGSTVNSSIISQITGAGGKVGEAAIQFVVGGEAAVTAQQLIDLGSGLLGVSGEQARTGLSGVFGKRLNPRIDMLYQSVEFREHEMSFKLIPRNKNEADMIDNILNMFHFYSLPDFGNSAEVRNLFIGYPYEFRITMFSQTSTNGHHINTIERSVLTHIDVDHAAADRTSFISEDGNEYYPTATILNMTFKEVRLPGRDPRSDQFGGGNVVLRGELNANGYPSTAMVDPKGEYTGAVDSTVATQQTKNPTDAKEPADLDTPGPNNPVMEVCTRIDQVPFKDGTRPEPQWQKTTLKRIQYEYAKNKYPGAPNGSLYGNPNAKLLTGGWFNSEIVNVGDYRYVTQSFAGSLANTGPVR